MTHWQSNPRRAGLRLHDGEVLTGASIFPPVGMIPGFIGRAMIALFRKDLPTALALFQKAASSNPDNAVPTLNAASVTMALDRDREAVDDIEEMLLRKPPTDRILLATAYMTWGAGWIGLDVYDAAERAAARSIELHGTSSTAYELWSEIRRDQGDSEGARKYHEQALAVSGYFENYGELAALYFRMAWREGEPTMRSPFTNPSTVTVRGGTN